MTSHNEADIKVAAFKERWTKVHECFKEWVARMTTLVECWNKLDGNVGELSSWVATKDSSAPEGSSEISIEQLETQLNTLKTMFAEKQKLVSDLEAYGPVGSIPVVPVSEAAVAPPGESANTNAEVAAAAAAESPAED